MVGGDVGGNVGGSVGGGVGGIGAGVGTGGGLVGDGVGTVVGGGVGAGQLVPGVHVFIISGLLPSQHTLLGLPLSSTLHGSSKIASSQL